MPRTKPTAAAATTPLTVVSTPSSSSATVRTAVHAKVTTTRASSSGSAPARVLSAPSLKPSTHPPAATDDCASADAQPRERGWDPIKDKRFRIALVHNYADSDDGTNVAPSPSTSAVAVDASDDAAAELCEEVCPTPMSDALLSQCRPTEPHIEATVEAALANSINNAYTASGYPFVTAAGNTRGAVYGSFIDLCNPSLSSLELPPRRSIIVAPRLHVGLTDDPLTHSLTEMDTLLSICWSRGDRTMPSSGTASSAPASQGKGSALSGLSSSSSSNNIAATTTTTTTSPHTPAVPCTIAHHLSQHPEGIHGVHSSPALRKILVEGTLPATLASVPSAPMNAAAHAPASASGGLGSLRAAATDTAVAAAPPTSSPLIGSQTVLIAKANVPPLPTPPQSNAPVQHTLVSASTFNHLSVYVVAHQDGNVLYTAALQSLSVSIATRKVTAQQLILVGREEVDALVMSPLTPHPTMPPKRTRVAFTDVAVDGEERDFFFSSKSFRFVGADARKNTISAAPIRFTVEPHLLIGNQNGDVFVFALLQERVVQHINFNGSTANPSAGASVTGKNGAGIKVVFSPVSCIAEVQNGIDVKITQMVEEASVAKHSGQSTFDSDGTPVGFAPTPAGAGAAANAEVTPSHYYYRVPSSLYAIGFDDGQMLIMSVTCEGAWMLRHLNSHCFGMRPIRSIAVRVPSFYARLWTSYLPPITPAKSHHNNNNNNDDDDATDTSAEAPVPVTTLVTAAAALIVRDEGQRIAAISCNGGVISLVRLPDMSIISSVAPTDYNAVGEILALQWTATSQHQLLLPNVLVASGEDDTMTAFQLLWQFLVSAVGSGHHHHNNNSNNDDTLSQPSSTESFVTNARLRVLEKKRFHRSWVSRLGLMPVVLPAAIANPKDGSSLGGGGMPPQYLGVCIIASSYDRRTSFWPYLFHGVRETRAMDGPRNTNAPFSADSVGDGAAGQRSLNSVVSIPGVDGSPLDTATVPDQYVLVGGPTTVCPLHTELVLGAAAAGGGTSFFMVTMCCRGRVMFWSLRVRV
ncbi:hypothetical protein JKF63_07839 [Porcisia hertigi]|uniref:Uncharacterized protein n=1 Tax=Porcisia hertigi TaxID=2761500 RepID=A0A836LMP2_9TRYP|nr:hypothetical protein JKF63_07839 [Porcisia hertigi]